ncbi:type IV pilus modification protein PilV [Rhodanobacter sp. PCA2]|uniref:type IV pilus modification protein PilV n=1 Tax=Rhodanobacter sp. PCA2 TaxID=2006117 RepID=UPI002106C37E|nr:type IV pilus modification protein PilV [Rhodanobacter sp. PCA2]MBA2077998.1 type IV pilus modification protein PilV [Rhodanobacter sp. PCA2]
MRVRSRQRGVSLVEVLVAVLIFSIGLVGLAGLLVMATRSNHAAYLRTQVTFLAGNMADRMRANPAGVWNGAYDAASYQAITGSTTCDKSAACNAADVASRDQQEWRRMLATLLPGADAAIACDRSSVGYDPTAQLNRRPPYGGHCEMTLSWSERRAGDQAHSDAFTQTFAWGFQP